MERNWRVLDIGCGCAGFTRVLEHQARLEQPPVGLDLSRGMLSLARRDTAGEGAPALTQGTAAALPFADATFQLIVSGHAFKYLDDDELHSTLVEAQRVLKPGGLFVAWEFAPTRSNLLDRWNRWFLTVEVPMVRLRGYRELQAVAYNCGFDWVQPAQLRPFLVPPIPRVSLIMGRAPEGWRSTVFDGRRVLEPSAANA
ncbi:MAG: class I SAM-dependent methyltransferase [Chloroflexi bacterium]|nr:class I SAM-dependent methyltransferase [Chloroflexota bacterium]